MSLRFFWVTLLALLLAMPALPQASTGAVSGTVRDQTGAVIPGASVALSNVGTGVRSRGATNQAGYYTFPGVIPGPYRIEIEVQGMLKYEAAVTVQVQQSLVIDPVLKPGQTTTTVVVEDVTPMVTVDNPTLGHVLERGRIEQLPINGRNFESLLRTVPGMEGQRAYGTREGAMEVTLDGSPISDRVRARSQVRPPGLDTIQEFKVETNVSSAKFTRPTTLILTTKSGTNELHGTLFETHRNNAFGKARRREDNYSKPPQLIRNEYGGTLGGPVLLPKLYDGHNRTFWFYSYEGSRRVSGTTLSYQVPTEAMWNGDFSELKDSQGRLYALYDPWTTDSKTFQRQPFNYGGKLNVMDPKRISPLGRYLAGITPRPTLPDVNPLVSDNWYGAVPSWNRNYTTSARLDHRFTETDSFYARYTQGGYSDLSSAYGVPTSDGGTNAIVTSSPNRSLALSWIRTSSPTLFNEVLASVSRERYYAGNKVEKDFNAELGLPNPFGSHSFPVINQPAFGDLSYQPHNMNGSFNTYFLVDDNVTKVAGRHELQFGAHTRWDYVNLLPDQQATAGSVVPQANWTALWDSKGSLQSPLTVARTGYGFSSLLLGLNRYQMRLNHGMFYGRSKEYALYFQDNWKVTPRLTLNLGVRWEAWPPYKEKYDNLVGFDLKRDALVLTQDLDRYYTSGGVFPGVVTRLQELGANFISYSEAGMPQRLQSGNYLNFGPRAGFAYRTTSSAKPLVIRGGFRISYFPIPMRGWSEYSRSSAPHTAFLSYDLDDLGQSPDGFRSWSLRSIPNVVAGVNSRNVIDPHTDARSITRGSVNANFFSPELPDARVHDWNLTLEKEVMADTVAKVSYVGTHVANLELFYNHNPAMPSYIWYATKGVPLPSGELGAMSLRPYDQKIWAAVQEYGKWGWSNSGAMQFELERRYNKGIGFQVFYVVTNAMTAGGRNWSVMLMPTNQFLPGLVPERFDERNRFLNYQRDTSIPKHRVRWNWIADLPFGRGKPLAGGAGSLLNRVIGGWQIAGMGSLNSTYFPLPTGIYPNGNQVERYGYQYPIEDCRSGRCYPGYLWWIGYIPANQINSYDASGKPNGVMGVPGSYQPSAEPLIPWPKNPDRNDPMYSYFGGNTVWLPMKDGSQMRTTYAPGDHFWRNQYVPGVRQWGLDAALYKTIPINERFKLRFNADFFNVLNHPGNPNSIGSDGVLAVRNSGSGARELQLTLRLSW